MLYDGYIIYILYLATACVGSLTRNDYNDSDWQDSERHGYNDSERHGYNDNEWQDSERHGGSRTCCLSKRSVINGCVVKFAQ